ncbi:MAG: DnaJ domain-containing protein [Alphaproteobacteria bacterium]|nr:DnaJ domain-containing protein [Alphaproteobacteria bacterium]
MIKKTKRQSKYFAPQTSAGEHHTCDHAGCNKAGEYRAPKNPRLKEYYWFCLEHVQEYNAHWNYYETEPFADETDNESKRFRFSSHIKYNFGFDFDLGYDFFQNDSLYSSTPSIRLDANERRSLAVMELSVEELTIPSLKTAYKKAVKKYHPDLNQTSKEAEEIFKILSTSYKSILTKLESLAHKRS